MSSLRPDSLPAAAPPLGGGGEVAGHGRLFALLASGESVARVLGFVTTIVLARTLGTAMFGVVAFALAVRLYLLIMVENGVDSVGVREVASDAGFLARVAPGLILLRLAVAAVLVGLVTVLGLFVLPQPDGAILAGFSLTLLCFAVNPRWMLLGLRRGGRLAVGRAVGELTMLVLVVAVVHGGHDVARVPLAQFVADGVAALVLGHAVRGVLGRRGWRESLPEARGVMREAAPMAGHGFLGLVIFNADILMLRLFRGAESVGAYAAAYAPISFCLNLGVTFYQSLLPSLSRADDALTRQGIYRNGIRQVLLAGVPIAVGGTLLARPGLELVFGPDYGSGAAALAILSASVPLSLLRNVGQAAIVAGRRQAILFQISGIGAVVNLGLNLLLIPRFGLSGAAAVTWATELLRTILTLRAARGLGLRAGLATAAVLPVSAGAVMALVLSLGAALHVIVVAVLGMAAYGVIVGAGPLLRGQRALV